MNTPVNLRPEIENPAVNSCDFCDSGLKVHVI